MMRFLIVGFRDIGDGLANVLRIPARWRRVSDDEMLTFALVVMWLGLIAWIWWP